jgi:hypothetical protein
MSCSDTAVLRGGAGKSASLSIVSDSLQQSLPQRLFSVLPFRRRVSLHGVSRQSMRSHAREHRKPVFSDIGTVEKWLNGFFAETAQGQQSAVVSFRPGMTAVDADVILEAVAGGENSSRQDTDVLRQSGAIKL